MSLDAAYDVERHPLSQRSHVEVCRCTHRSSGAARAVKVYHTEFLDARRAAMAVEEGELAKSLAPAPQLVHIYDVFAEQSRVAIVMEMMERGTLFRAITQRGSIPEAQARVLARHLFTGLALLHGAGVMHRDIKPENLFLRGTQSDPEDVMVIGDFGFATRTIPSEDLVGSPQYSAPELALIGLQQSAHSRSPGSGGRPLYNEKCDVWSAGVVTFVMLSGLLPFDGATPADVFTAVVRNNVPFDKVASGKISALAKGFYPVDHVPPPFEAPLSERGAAPSLADGLSEGESVRVL